MVVVFFVFRMRFYAAWCGAEASCISAGLGCYPEKSLSKPGGGPTVNYRYIKTRLANIFTGGTHQKSLTQDVGFVKIKIFSSPLLPVLTPPPRRRTTSEPFRTLTATTRTSVWRCDTACVTGTCQCNGGYITTSTPTPPSSPTPWGKALRVRRSFYSYKHSTQVKCGNFF